MWKRIEDYPDYMISDHGEVMSLKHRKPLLIHGGFFPNGYQFVCLRKDGKSKNVLVHRLVAAAFVNNPFLLPVVNHKDGNKANNKADNLKWVTQAQNLAHAVQIGIVESQCKIRRKVTVKCGEHISTFETMKDCSLYFGFTRGWLNGRIKNHGCTFNYGEYQIEVHGRG